MCGGSSWKYSVRLRVFLPTVICTGSPAVCANTAALPDGQFEVGGDVDGPHAEADRPIALMILQIDVAIVEGLDAIAEDDIDSFLRRQQKRVRPRHRDGGFRRRGGLFLRADEVAQDSVGRDRIVEQFPTDIAGPVDPFAEIVGRFIRPELALDGTADR